MAAQAPATSEELPSGVWSRSALDWLRIVSFYRRALLIALLVPIVASLVIAVLLHTKYEVEARLLVRIGREYGALPERGGGGINVVIEPQKIVQTETDILSSEAVRIGALQALGPLNVFPDLERVPPEPPEVTLDRAVRLLGSEIKIENPPNSFIFRIGFSHRSPVVAAAVVDKLISTYIEERRQVFFQAQSSFLANVRDQLKAQLDGIEADIQAVRRADKIFDLPEQRRALIERREDQAQQIGQVEARRSALSAEAGQTGTSLQRTPQEIVTGTDRTRQQGWDQLRARLSEAEAERARLSALFGPNSAQALDRQIAALRQQMGSTPAIVSDVERRGRNPMFENLSSDRARIERDLAGAVAQAGEMTRQAQAIETSLASLEAADIKLTPLTRRRGIIEQIYADFSRRTDEARVEEHADESRSANVRIVQPARIPSRGRSMRGNVLIAGLALGVLMAPATVFFLATLQNVLMTPSDILRTLGVHNLGTTWLNTRRRRKRRDGLTDEIARANEILPIVHAIRTARRDDAAVARVVFFAQMPRQAGDPRAIVRDVASELASEEAQPVLLVDTLAGDHARHLTAEQLLGDPVPEPLDDRLPLDPNGARTKDIRTRRVTGRNLFLARAEDLLPLLSTPAAPGTGPLLPRFSRILIDGAQATTDFRVLRACAGADATVLVIAADETRAGEATEAMEHIRDVGGEVLGTVLAGRQTYLPGMIDRPAA